MTLAIPVVEEQNTALSHSGLSRGRRVRGEEREGSNGMARSGLKHGGGGAAVKQARTSVTEGSPSEVWQQMLQVTPAD